MFESGTKIVAEEIKALKAEIKAEMLRRNLNGSVASFGGAGYDFVVVPQSLGVIKQEHFEKLRAPMTAIDALGIPEANVNAFPSLTNLKERLDINKAQVGKSSTTHGCNTSCTGLCYSSCTSCSGCTGCSGCGGACSYGCSGCTGSCSGGCSGCGGACTTSCTGCGGNCTGCYGTS